MAHTEAPATPDLYLHFVQSSFKYNRAQRGAVPNDHTSSKRGERRFTKGNRGGIGQIGGHVCMVDAKKTKNKKANSSLRILSIDAV
jgi:hypothetical protein